MITKKEYEEKKKSFDYEIERLEKYIDVEVFEIKDATGKITMCFWLKKKNGKRITCVFDLITLETMAEVLEALDKVE